MVDLVTQMGDLPHWARLTFAMSSGRPLTTLAHFHTLSLRLSQVTTSVLGGRNCGLYDHLGLAQHLHCPHTVARLRWRPSPPWAGEKDILPLPKPYLCVLMGGSHISSKDSGCVHTSPHLTIAQACTGTHTHTPPHPT